MRCSSLAARWAVLATAMVFASACSSVPDRPVGPTAEEIELQNVKTSLNMVRNALKEMADDRDRFQDLYLSSDQELVQRKDDTEFLESQLRHQRVTAQQAEDSVAGLEAKVAESDRLRSSVAVDLEQARELQKSQLARVQKLEGERDDLKRQLVEVTTEQEQLAKESRSLAKERDRLRNEIASMGGQLETGQASASEQIESRGRTITQLQSELQLLRPLKSKVERLEQALAETEAAKKAEAERRVAVERTKTTTVEMPEVRSYAIELARQSWSDAQKGEFNANNLSFFGIVGALMAVAFVALIMSRRGRRARRKLVEARDELERTVAQLEAMRTEAPAAPAAARTITAPPELVRAAAPQAAAPPAVGGVTEAAPLPSHVPEPTFPVEEMTQMLHPSMGLHDANTDIGATADMPEMTEFIDPAMTEDLNSVVAQAQQQNAQGVAPAGDNDDELLADLQRVINKKLSS